MRNEENQQLMLPKNIRQIGTFGDTYKIYVEDFVYTYVHQFIHRRKKDDLVLAAVLLGRTIRQGDQEYVFISGAQKVDFRTSENGETEDAQTENERESMGEQGAVPNTVVSKQQEFWDRVYQGIKQYFDDQEILGWYFNLDGSGLEINTQLQQFFESTYKKGSRFLYYEDSVEREDAFYVQEQHKLQKISGYAVYYEKNPQMQEFMIAEKEKATPKPLRDIYSTENRDDDVAQNYRAIMNKLNEKPQKKKVQPVIYVAGVAVLAVVAATGVSQVGNYQNLKVLEQTMQTLSGSVAADGEEDALTEADQKAADKSDADENPTENGVNAAESNDESQETSADSAAGPENSGQTPADEDTTDQASATSNDQSTSTNESADAAVDDGQTAARNTNDVQQTAATPPNYYIVKKGDSLVSISKSVYNNTDMVDEICSLNKIENMDVIYEGQKLLLP